MNISPIIYKTNYTYKKPLKPQSTPVSFQAHPDFDILEKKYDVTASSFFRRGPIYGGANEQFIDVLNIFKELFSEKNDKPKKMLLAGIGNSQEPFSYLAVIKSLTKGQNLSDVLDLNIVDLQSQPEKEQLFRNSYYDAGYQPKFAFSSFVYDHSENDISFSRYRIKDDIFEYLNSTYKDKNKSKFDSRIQEAILECKNEEYDVISINNTLPYIKDENERIKTTQNVHRILKQGGIYITDPLLNFLEEANISDKFQKIGWGIYKKIK